MNFNNKLTVKSYKLCPLSTFTWWQAEPDQSHSRSFRPPACCHSGCSPWPQQSENRNRKRQIIYFNSRLNHSEKMLSHQYIEVNNNVSYHSLIFYVPISIVVQKVNYINRVTSQKLFKLTVHILISEKNFEVTILRVKNQ